MDSKPRIDVVIHGYVAELTLHNPARRNAMTYAMWQALGDQLEALGANSDIRVMVLRGAGDRAFCAGNDISEFREWRNDPQSRERYDAASARAMSGLQRIPVPVIARIEGACVGGGLEIALAADLRIASTTARFAITPARLGLGYKLDDVQLVVDRVGAQCARRLLFTAQMHTAEEAAAAGWVDEVAVDLDSGVAQLADAIAANAPRSVRALKAAITEASKPPGERDHERVRRLVDACDRSEDYQEGQRAFAEKRAPVFTGR